MRVFGSPYGPILLIDDAVQAKISFISKPNATPMDIADINPLYHVVRECLSWINGNCSVRLRSLNLVWIKVLTLADKTIRRS